MIFFFSYIRKEKKFISLVCVQARKKKKRKCRPVADEGRRRETKKTPPIPPLKVPESGPKKKERDKRVKGGGRG